MTEYWEKLKNKLEKNHRNEVQNNTKIYQNALHTIGFYDNVVIWKDMIKELRKNGYAKRNDFPTDIPAIDLEGFTAEQTVALLNHILNENVGSQFLVCFKLKKKDVEGHHLMIFVGSKRKDEPRNCGFMFFDEAGISELEHKNFANKLEDKEIDEKTMIEKIRTGFQEPVNNSEDFYFTYPLQIYVEIVKHLHKDDKDRNLRLNETISKFFKLKESGNDASWEYIVGIFGTRQEENIRDINKRYYENKAGKKFLKLKTEINNEREESTSHEDWEKLAKFLRSLLSSIEK